MWTTLLPNVTFANTSADGDLFFDSSVDLVEARTSHAINYSWLCVFVGCVCAVMVLMCYGFIRWLGSRRRHLAGPCLDFCCFRPETYVWTPDRFRGSARCARTKGRSAETKEMRSEESDGKDVSAKGENPGPAGISSVKSQPFPASLLEELVGGEAELYHYDSQKDRWTT